MKTISRPMREQDRDERLATLQRPWVDVEGFGRINTALDPIPSADEWPRIPLQEMACADLEANPEPSPKVRTLLQRLMFWRSHV